MDKFSDRKKKLNVKQKLAVETIDGPVMVTAGPGTGKTEILALRIANILSKTDMNPNNILALTFTNAAVHAMRQRLLSLVGTSAYQIGIWTFHSFCEEIVRRYPDYFPESHGSKVIDSVSKMQIVEEILSQGNYEKLSSFHDPGMHTRSVADAIDKIKSEGYSSNDFAELIPHWRKEMLASDDVYYKRDSQYGKAGDIKQSEQEKIENKIARATELVDIMEKYQNELSKRGLHDFADIVLSVLAALREKENLRFDIQEQFQYILVDEHQDTNHGQNELISLLASAAHLDAHPNLFTVGDEKQSIYRFTGASQETFKLFHTLYSDIVEISLTENYRSTQSILDAAHSLIQNSGEISHDTKLKSNVSDIAKPSVLQFSNYKFELLHIAHDIRNKIDGGVNVEEIAVVYRQHKFADDLCPILSNLNIPYTIHRGDNIFEYADTRHILDLLRVIENPRNNSALGRVLFADFLDLDPHDTIRALDYVRGDDSDLIDRLTDENSLKRRKLVQIDPFVSFAKKILSLHHSSQNTDVVNTTKIILTDLGVLSHILRSPDGRKRLIRIDAILDEIKKHFEGNPRASLADIVYVFDTFQKYNMRLDTKSPEIDGGISLHSAHGTKGLEFEHVYIMNMTEKGWEKAMSARQISLPIQEYQGTLDDERRLLYVALTRARQSVTMSYSDSDWRERAGSPSRFFSEIDDEFLQYVETEKLEQEYLDKLSLFARPVQNAASLLDPEFLREKFLSNGLSVTALDNYSDCPQKFLYRSLIRLPSEYSPTLEFGTMMHRVLQLFLLGHERTMKKLQEIMQEVLEERVCDKKQKEDFKKRGEEFVEKYFQKYHQSWNDPVKLEESICGSIVLRSGHQLVLSGKMDKIVYLNGDKKNIQIVDYKTGRAYSQKTKLEKEKLKRQLVFYYLLYRISAPNINVARATLDFIEPNPKTGELEQFDLEITEQDMKDLHGDIESMADDIISGEFLGKGCGKKECEFCKKL